MGEQVGAQDSETGLKDCDGCEADDENVQCAHAPMHEHLVDYDLEEQGNESKQLEEERGQQYFAERTAGARFNGHSHFVYARGKLAALQTHAPDVVNAEGAVLQLEAAR
jgi:hypothetical protein